MKGVLFWVERLLLSLLLSLPSQVFFLGATFIFRIILFLTTLLSLPFFFLSPNLYSVGPSGIGGIWLFLLDRLAFYLAFEYSQPSSLQAVGDASFELTFPWYLAALLSILIHSIYIVDHLLPPHNDTPISTDASDVKEFVEELCKDAKRMRADMELTNHSLIESIRNERALFRQELTKHEKIMMTRVDATEHLLCSQLGTLTDNLRLNLDDNWEQLRHELSSKIQDHLKFSTQDFYKDTKSAVDSLLKTHTVIQKTAIEANTAAASRDSFNKDVKLRETTKEARKICLIFPEDQSKRRMIRGEEVEGFSELREEVRRVSMEAEFAAKELARATAELVEGAIQQWEEDNADYLASLPFLYCNHPN